MLTKKCGMHQSSVDKELCFKHDGAGVLTCIMTIHVDDLKIAGEPSVVKELLKVLEKEFGELTVQWGKFTNCGVQHIQNPMTREITLDQIDFLSKLHAIEHPQLSTGVNEEQCVE